MSLFLDSHKAAALLGYGVRHFTRKFVETGKLKVHIFRSGNGCAPGRRNHKFLTVDVEKLKGQ
jgi:hypothetical protein